MKTHLLISAFLLLVIAGCTAEQFAFWDRKAQSATQPGVAESTGAIGAVVTGNPATGLMIATGIQAAANLYLYLRKKQYKSALKAVVDSVEPFMPVDPPQRRELEAKQGPKVTAMVKKVKA